MNWKQLIIAFVAFDFLAYTVWVLWDMGIGPAFGAAVANPATVQMLGDLVLALGVAVVLMWRDARANGINPIPYTAMTALTGSPGVVLYLARRFGGPRASGKNG